MHKPHDAFLPEDSQLLVTHEATGLHELAALTSAQSNRIKTICSLLSDQLLKHGVVLGKPGLIALGHFAHVGKELAESLGTRVCEITNRLTELEERAE